MAVRKKLTVICASGLNVRAEPSYKADIVRVLKCGETVEQDKTKEAPSGWIAVKGGYCAAEYLQ